MQVLLRTLLSRVPHHTRRTDRRPFYGWRIVLLAALAMAMTAPGQTAGVTPFIGPMSAELGLSSSSMSTAHLVGTLGAAAALPLVGRVIDVYGPRRVIIVIGLVFGASLLALSVVQEIIGLTAGFIAVRVAGQGALSLAAITVASYWFDRRRGLALAAVSAGGFAGIQLTPILLERLIATIDWRQVWQLEGLAVWAIVIPLALMLRDHPHHVGQQVDGDQSAPAATEATGMTRAEAVRTPYFWVLMAVVGVSSLLTTGLVFHQINLLAERGFSSAEAAGNFLPQVVAGVAATFLMGHLVDRTRQPKLLVATAIAPLALGLVGATMIHPGWTALVYGAIIGASSNAVRAIETSLAPRLLGTRSLGEIRSLLGSAGAMATALGPVLFALGSQASGSYLPVLLVSALLPVATVAGALIARLPQEADTALSAPGTQAERPRGRIRVLVSRLRARPQRGGLLAVPTRRWQLGFPAPQPRAWLARHVAPRMPRLATFPGSRRPRPGRPTPARAAGTGPRVQLRRAVTGPAAAAGRAMARRLSARRAVARVAAPREPVKVTTEADSTAPPVPARPAADTAAVR